MTGAKTVKNDRWQRGNFELSNDRLNNTPENNPDNFPPHKTCKSKVKKMRKRNRPRNRRQMYNNYDLDLKKSVVRYAELNGNKETCTHFGISEANIRRWRRLKDDIFGKPDYDRGNLRLRKRIDYNRIKVEKNQDEENSQSSIGKREICAIFCRLKQVQFNRSHSYDVVDRFHAVARPPIGQGHAHNVVRHSTDGQSSSEEPIALPHQTESHQTSQPESPQTCHACQRGDVFEVEQSPQQHADDVSPHFVQRAVRGRHSCRWRQDSQVP